MRARATRALGLALLAGAATLALAAPRARACGGGLVTVPGETATATGAQRIVFATHGSVTDVITEVGVPTTSASYGVVIPVPAQPMLDEAPVAASALDALDTITAPRIYETGPVEHDGIACGCGSAADKSNAGGSGDRGVDVSKPVNIGPVTAVVLTGDSGSAINDWLAANGFAIPTEQQPLVDAYSGAGRYLIALRRNDAAAPGGPTSVGVHFQLPATAPFLPLRFARLGAAPTVAFTVFVAAPTVAAPSDPFATLTVNDLGAATLRSSGYAAAVTDAIAARGGRAFVIEGAFPPVTFTGRLGPELEDLINAAGTVTRLTTILPASALTEDVTFDGTFTATIPTVRYVEALPQRHGGPLHGHGLGAGAAVAAAAVLVRRRRRAG